MHLSRLFQRTVQMHGGRPALALGKGPALSWAELDVRVRGLANMLRRDFGLTPGDRVTIAMKNCTEYTEALLAMWMAGLCPVPVNNKLHPREIGYVIENSGSRACVSSADLLQSLCPVVDALPGVAMIDARGQAWISAAERTDAPAPDADVLRAGRSEDLGWLFYTSGTTGRPKGVMLTHANLVFMALNFFADLLDVHSDDALLHVAPMSHGGGMYGIAYMLRGGLQVVTPSGGLDEEELFDLLNHYQRVSLFAAPTIVNRMVAHAKTFGLPEGADPCRGLRCVATGGAPFYVEDIKAAVRTFGPRIAQVYGQGESPMTISAMRAERIAAAVTAEDDMALASVGFPQTTVEIEILDGEGRLLPPGEMGEVTVRSPTVMKGYWDNPEATAKTVPGGVLYTGDVGLVDERGLLHLKDRSKDVIISGGTNIYPREVEEALLRHPAVEEVSVIGTPDQEWGESVTAVIVCKAGQSAPRADLDAACLESIARFKRPKHYVFVDKLPKNATGKVLKNELRQMIGNGT